jgi:nitrate/nitrite transport system ATP-binding protein
MTMGPYLELWKLGKTYGSQVVVQDFDLTVHEGELVSLIGHSGCGKSTVLSMVAGLTKPTAGQVAVAGREVSGPGTDRGVVFQTPALLPWMTAVENVLLGVEQVHPRVGGRKQLQIAERHLASVGLADAGDRKPDELSAGMRQRVGIARAFALSPKVLLLDEPFGMLDSLTRLELQDVLLEVWTRERTTAFMVTHDVDEALFLSDRVAMMTSGPAARLGEVLEVPFPRPRSRRAVMESAEYDRLKESLLGFLEDQAPGERNGSEQTPAA